MPAPLRQEPDIPEPSLRQLAYCVAVAAIVIALLRFGASNTVILVVLLISFGSYLLRLFGRSRADS
jgi:hypothetical protein